MGPQVPRGKPGGGEFLRRRHRRQEIHRQGWQKRFRVRQQERGRRSRFRRGQSLLLRAQGPDLQHPTTRGAAQASRARRGTRRGARAGGCGRPRRRRRGHGILRGLVSQRSRPRRARGYAPGRRRGALEAV